MCIAEFSGLWCFLLLDKFPKFQTNLLPPYTYSAMKMRISSSETLVVATLHDLEGSVLCTDHCETSNFKWRHVVAVVTVLQPQAVWHDLCLCRENDEEVGLGEVDERVSMLMVFHLHVAHLPHQSMYSMSASAKTAKLALHLLNSNLEWMMG